jgi:YidC/Oxa1 family membrane protein insertase
MDRRTLLFIIAVSLSFLGLNLYFSNQTSKTNRELLQQKEEKSKQQSALLQQQISLRQAKLSDLPLIDIFANKGDTHPLAMGINVQGNTLLLAWDSNPPKTIYVNGEAQTLVTKDPIKGGPIVYGKQPFNTLEIVNLPSTGTFDMQLLTFDSEDHRPAVHLVQYANGSLDLFDEVSANGIALYKTDKGYLPLGFYEHQGKVFVELQNLSLLTELIHVQESTATPMTTTKGEQKYYVLENAYQQLVFTNVGGSIVEINLPFESKKDSSSVVKEIGFDRQLVEENPENATFPAFPFFRSGNDKLQEGTLGGYYPLLRRSITGKKSVIIPSEYNAFNIISDYPEMAQLIYQVTSFTKDSITFEARQPHRKITKRFTLHDSQQAAPYCFELSITIEGDRRGLWLTSGVHEVEIMSNSSSPEILYHITRKQKATVEKLDLPKVGETVNMSSLHPDWVVNSNGYLGIILDPLQDTIQGFSTTAIYGGKIPTRLSLIDPAYSPYPATKYPGYQILLPLTPINKPITLRIYAGPFEEDTLKAVDKMFSDPTTGYNPHYTAARTFHGWFKFVSAPFAKLLFIVLSFFHNITNSWGFSIILLTIFLRLLLYPLNTWSIKSMRRMQQISPEIKAIQKKYKKDPKRSQMEIMALYRAKKVNPFTGCVPILIQIPFLIAMFDLLKSSFQLRGASFIPGWIPNLTAPDVLFQWKTPIFFIGTQFHLLPILLGVVMFIQQRLSASANITASANELTDQQRQQRAMGTMMTVLFTVMFYNFPSGLNIYWLSSMSLGILQQWITNKVLDKKKDKG